MYRREFLRKVLLGGVTLALAKDTSWPKALVGAPSEMKNSALPTRRLGSTGYEVGIVSLGGEGVLRTTGRFEEARAVIERALELGINYCDTAPAYQQSQDYYGRTLGPRRDRIFLASKTHERSKTGSLRLLTDSLRRLKTDRLDLWQLHDLRTQGELAQIFGPGGAIEAVDEAKRQGKIRFVGVTGHHDPDILLSAIGQYPFDAVLIPVNAADKVRLSFIEQVIPVATAKGMAVIGMKVLEHGNLFGRLISAQDAIAYALSQQVSTVILGCSSPVQVQQNVAAALSFQHLGAREITALEERLAPRAASFNLFKK